ncbi:hypothetical protein IKW73_03530 [Candidatus Saccharibacteria bacterium]|nr:hypothetical protein [Candidatus Saccharibacteria bacterium]
MIYKNLTARELYASIPSIAVIFTLMDTGIKAGSTQLAVSSMEELIRRKHENFALSVLEENYRTGKLKTGTSMMSMVVSSLTDEHKSDMCLQLANIISDEEVKDVETSNLIRTLYAVASKDFPTEKVNFRDHILDTQVDDNGNPVVKFDVEKPGTAEKQREFILHYMVDDNGNPVVDGKSEPEAKSQAPRLMAPWPPVEEDW